MSLIKNNYNSNMYIKYKDVYNERHSKKCQEYLSQIEEITSYTHPKHYSGVHLEEHILSSYISSMNTNTVPSMPLKTPIGRELSTKLNAGLETVGKEENVILIPFNVYVAVKEYHVGIEVNNSEGSLKFTVMYSSTMPRGYDRLTFVCPKDHKGEIGVSLDKSAKKVKGSFRRKIANVLHKLMKLADSSVEDELTFDLSALDSQVDTQTLDEISKQASELPNYLKMACHTFKETFGSRTSTVDCTNIFGSGCKPNLNTAVELKN